MLLNVGENLAIAKATIFRQPRNNGCFREPVRTQESQREAIRMIAPIDKCVIKVLEHLRQLRPRNRHASNFFGVSAILDLSTKQLTTLNFGFGCHRECCLTEWS